MRRTALVTGGSRGIGRACVSRLAREGWSVVFLYRSSREEAGSLCEQLRQEGLDAEGVCCDITDGEALQAAFDEILRTRHHIDLLVNNAGVAHIGLLTDMSDAEWDRLFDTNVKAAFRCIRRMAPDMVSRGSGCIINISSMWGQVGASCEAAYSATKAALIGLTKALAQELGPSGVRVNCVAPGTIATDMNRCLDEETLRGLADDTPLGRIGTPEDVAEAVAFLAGDGASFITGQVLAVNGGYVIT